MNLLTFLLIIIAAMLAGAAGGIAFMGGFKRKRLRHAVSYSRLEVPNAEELKNFLSYNGTRQA